MEKVKVGELENLAGNNYTISTWIKAKRERNGDHVIIARGFQDMVNFDYKSYLEHFKLYIQKDFGLMRLYSHNIGDFGCGIVDNGEWNHIAVVGKEYSLNFYLNGLHLYAFDVPGGILYSNEKMVIGSMPDGSLPFMGEMEALRVLNEALTESEIFNLFKEKTYCDGTSFKLSNVPNAPLYEDPLFNSAKDGTIIWDSYGKKWWFIYMQIRNGFNELGVSIHHGTTIGAASSNDGGLSWEYRGTLRGLEFEQGKNTFWAPDIVWDNGKYHAFISYVKGIHPEWYGDKRIIHYTSTNMMDWVHEGPVENLTSCRCLDACVYKMPNGKWGMWFKDEVNNLTGFAVGEDLYSFKKQGHIDFSTEPLEGSDVFFWKGFYWLLGDDLPSYNGIRVYRSNDCLKWDRKSNILCEPGSRNKDRMRGQHPEIIVNGDDAYVFYWVAENEEIIMNSCQICLLQVAQLDFNNEELVCDRNKVFELNLPTE